MHLLILVKQKHTQFPGPGRTEHNVVGHRLFPTFAAKAGGLFFIVFGVCAALGGLVQINPVWLWGPYNPAQVSAGVAARLVHRLPRRVDPPLAAVGHQPPRQLPDPGAVLADGRSCPGVIFTLMLAYPMLERKLTGDTVAHHLLQRPRDVPVRTALGAMALAFWGVLFISGGNDVIADKFDISLNAMTWIGRIGLVVVPPFAYWATYRICLGLEQHDREILEHGIETGIIRRLPNGEFIEVHQPLGPVDAHGHGQLAYGGAPVPKKMNQIGGARRAVRGFFTPLEEPAQVALEQRREGYGLDAAEEAREPGRELTTLGPPVGGWPAQRGRPSFRGWTPAGAARLTAARQRTEAPGTTSGAPAEDLPPGPCVLRRAEAAARRYSARTDRTGRTQRCGRLRARAPAPTQAGDAPPGAGTGGSAGHWPAPRGSAGRSRAGRAVAREPLCTTGDGRTAARGARALLLAGALVPLRGAPPPPWPPEQARPAPAPGGAAGPARRRGPPPPQRERPSEQGAVSPGWRSAPRSTRTAGRRREQQRDAGDDDQPGVEKARAEAHQCRRRRRGRSGQ